MEAIERIRGYCCEVNQSQWEELVRVCLIVDITPTSFAASYPYAFVDGHGALNAYRRFGEAHGLTVIPFPDFLSKLKGEECDGDPFTASDTLNMARKKWHPKNGDEVVVEVAAAGDRNLVGNFVGMHGNLYVVKTELGFHGYWEVEQHLPNPTITRTEAEKILRKRIID